MRSLTGTESHVVEHRFPHRMHAWFITTTLAVADRLGWWICVEVKYGPSEPTEQ